MKLFEVKTKTAGGRKDGYSTVWAENREQARKAAGKDLSDRGLLSAQLTVVRKSLYAGNAVPGSIDSQRYAEKGFWALNAKSGKWEYIRDGATYADFVRKVNA